MRAGNIFSCREFATALEISASTPQPKPEAGQAAAWGEAMAFSQVPRIAIGPPNVAALALRGKEEGRPGVTPPPLEAAE
jgi:hypothetical protein